MGALDPQLSRISKLFADRDQTAVSEALRLRKAHTIALICGADVAGSYTLQLAVITAARLAARCFPSAVRVVLPEALRSAPCRVWPHLGLTFGAVLARTVGEEALLTQTAVTWASRSIIFGDASGGAGSLRATFDGWIARVGPANSTARLPEREYCTLAGVLCAALAVSEVFLAFAEITIVAGRRLVELSLWRPDLPATHADALGIPTQFLPREAWLLGLGHLGNAHLWTLASLPYPNPKDALFYLNDFDTIEGPNAETGIIFESGDAEELKTRTLAAWLKERKFDNRLVERKFDATFRLQTDEPILALCGFDSNPARRDLAFAGFSRTVESGLGGTASNFDVISLHTLPNARAPAELWPDLEHAQTMEAERARRLAAENAAYADLAEDECGRVLLAGKSIAVPFVGMTAATLAVAETLRLLHRGAAYGQIKLRLASPEGIACTHLGSYSPMDGVGIKFIRV